MIRPTLAALLLIAAPAWAADGEWIVLDPSGRSRAVVLIFDGQAIRLTTIPLGDAAGPALPPVDPPAPPDEPPGEPPPVADGLGFVEVARTVGATLSAETRGRLANTYRSIADAADPPPGAIGVPAWQTAMDAWSALNVKIQVNGLTTPETNDFIQAIQAKLASVWRLHIKTPADAARAMREIADGLDPAEGGIP